MDCDALIAENDENEVRKAFTVSERVAIAAAVAERLKGRQLANLKQNRGGNISTSGDAGKTRDLAAAKAGLGSGKTLEAAQVVIAKGAPELVAAMDAGKVTIHAAKSIASMPAEEQLSSTASTSSTAARPAARARAAPSPRLCPPMPVAPARAMKPAGSLGGRRYVGGRRGTAIGSFS